MSGVLKPGDRFGGRYVVESLIAEGGMASIYRALDEHTGRRVAVKVLYPYYSENEVIRARFVEEGNIQKSLGHPNVVHVHEVVTAPLAIVMEHVDGPTLDDYLAQQGQLPEDEILDIIIPVMSALGLAHSRGIIHRDLKPSNILLNRLRRGFQPKVMDFGVAKVKDAKHNLTATGTTVGTLHYMSPEQIVGSKSIDGRADIYSLGVTLYKLVTGEVPFNAPTEFALMMAQVEAPPLPPSKLRPGLSPELEAVILKAMAKKPTERFQTIREFTTALLNMRRGHEQTVRDTLTETISQELIDFALAADEVAKDRTAEMSFDILRATLSDGEDSLEATVEMAATLNLQPISAPMVGWAGASGEATLELTSQDVIRLSTLDGNITREDQQQVMEPTAETEVMARRSNEELRVTRPSGAVSPLPGTGSLVSESVETNSMAQRLKRAAEQVVVLDHDADSRDMTAPKVKERDYDKALAALPRPSGPKVVLGYNPADTQDKTYEKPNLRTRLPQFETSKSDENPIRRLRREAQGHPPQPASRVGPPPPPPQAPSTGSASLLERIDLAAQSAMDLARKHDIPRSWVYAIVFAVCVIVSCVLYLVARFLFG